MELLQSDGEELEPVDVDHGLGGHGDDGHDDAAAVPGAGADGGADPPVPAPAEPPPPPPGLAGPKAKAVAAHATVRIHGGRLCYYSQYTNFEAVCGNPDHGRCVMRRAPKKKFDGPDGVPRGGRPVGFMAAWLSLSHEVDSRAAHKDTDYLRERLASLDVREAQRNLVSLHGDAEGLFAKEREQDVVSGGVHQANSRNLSSSIPPAGSSSGYLLWSYFLRFLGPGADFWNS
eukprot:2708524-Pyramimonas_sp.AAC.1